MSIAAMHYEIISTKPKDQNDCPSTTPQHTQTLTSLMEARHSTRSFLPTPIPQNLLKEALALAQQTPSNSNLQPWRVKILSGNALQRLSNALLSAVAVNTQPTTAPIPDAYRHYRSALGKKMYGPDGYDVKREDKEGMEKARRRNYAFFDAPVGMVVCMDKSLAEVDVMCVGMYVQVLCLLLAERGVASCVQVSVAGYPDVIREELGIGEDMLVLTGIAVGFEDEAAGLNKLDMERDGWWESVEFVE
ncbi:hypothetical protein OPT61_g4373 [Boeremia exigua]|uniref:Uncharacterized protein n=1 Tax=Boeremia exigua TaxID=749465 RepID=A0ACC2IED7_9PLEO|nr:hypothetical protein OPT61_g4373 [Boeremia exigua]